MCIWQLSINEGESAEAVKESELGWWSWKVGQQEDSPGDGCCSQVPHESILIAYGVANLTLRLKHPISAFELGLGT